MLRGPWFKQRTVWLPTWRGCFAALSILLLAGFFIGKRLHGWLAVREPIADAKYVVIEGWVPDYVIKAAVEWSKQHETRLVFTTGMEIEQGSHLVTYRSYADLCAKGAIHMGAEAAKVMPAPASMVNMERTRAMAAALKTKVQSLDIPAGDRKINLFTLGTHARRSLMHFRHEMGSDWQVGVIAVPNAGYPEEEWWRYSEGAKSVITELSGLAAQCLGGE